MNPDRCAARQYSDEMVCSYCALRWDVNDPEPPACGKMRKPLQTRAPQQRAEFRSGLSDR